MTRVKIEPEVLRWARERAELSIVSLMKYFPKYEEWEEGEVNPTLKQLESFAKKTYTPLGYLFLPEPPEDKLPIPDYRTIDDAAPPTPSPNLLDTVHTMQRRQAWMRDYLIEQGEEPLQFVGSETMRAKPDNVALRIREILDLPDEWAEEFRTWTEALYELRQKVEEADVLIFLNGVVGNNTHRKLDYKEFRGFVLLDEYAPLIFVNNSDTKGAQMFTIAHELAHLLIGREGVFNLRQMQPSGGDYYVTQSARLGHRFIDTVIRAAKEGSLLYRDAYKLTGLTSKTFDEFEKQIKMAYP